MAENEEELVPTNDYVFKRIFGHIGNEEITKGLLSAIIEREVDSIDLSKNPILEKDIKTDKVGVLDVKAVFPDGTLCDVEMQLTLKKDIEKRKLLYWSKLFLSGRKEKEHYSKLNKTICILISKEKLGSLKEIKKYHTKWEIREEEYSKKVLTSMLEIHIIEIDKLTDMLNNNLINKNDKLALWLRFINNPKEMGEEEMEENEDIKQAKEELDKIQQDERERWLAFQREMYVMDMQVTREYGYDEGHEDGLKDGRKQGINKNKKEVVINMYKEKIDIDVICKVVKLDKEEVEKIIKENEETHE